jgi:hypothetical protein
MTRESWLRREDLRRDARVVAAFEAASMVPDPPPMLIPAWDPEEESIDDHERRLLEAGRKHREEVLKWPTSGRLRGSAMWSGISPGWSNSSCSVGPGTELLRPTTRP